QYRERDGKVRAREEGDILLHAILEHREILGGQVRHVFPDTLGDGHVERDEVDAGAKRGLRRLSGLRRLGAADLHGRCDEACADEREAPMGSTKRWMDHGTPTCSWSL